MARPLLMLATVLVGFLALAPAAGPTSRPLESNASQPASQIDLLVFAQLKKLGVQPGEVCSDGVFMRRVYLDAIGTLPTEEETREFLASKDLDKRQALVGRLLERKEFADYWAMKWSDLLRVKAEFPINLWPNAAQAYHHWIWESINQNKPYDRFVRELLTASGSNFRVPPVNFYRAIQSKQPQAIAQVVALTFMGARAEAWPKDRLAGMAAFFAQVGYKSTQEWKEEIVFLDVSQAAAAATQPAPVFPDGTAARLVAGGDPREAFADWLIDPGNPWFTRSIVNRIWCWLLGRGIIHEPDDIRPDNPPSNPQLLAYLERELIASHYDLKHIYRLILTSRTYQLSCAAPTSGPTSAASFARYQLRRLEAEVLIDAICQITGTTEKYSSPVPEPFTFIPEGQRSVTLPDGSISSPFLEMFGRPPRDTGLESERNNRSTADQQLHLLNSSHIQRKIEQGPKLRALIQGRATPRETTTRLYLTILSRFPTEDELKIVDAYFKAAANGRDAAVDLAWALINSDEFLYRH
jgi:hypothetical protein